MTFPSEKPWPSPKRAALLPAGQMSTEREGHWREIHTRDIPKIDSPEFPAWAARQEALEGHEEIEAL